MTENQTQNGPKSHHNPPPPSEDAKRDVSREEKEKTLEDIRKRQRINQEQMQQQQ